MHFDLSLSFSTEAIVGVLYVDSFCSWFRLNEDESFAIFTFGDPTADVRLLWVGGVLMPPHCSVLLPPGLAMHARAEALVSFPPLLKASTWLNLT